MANVFFGLTCFLQIKQKNTDKIEVFSNSFTKLLVPVVGSHIKIGVIKDGDGVIKNGSGARKLEIIEVILNFDDHRFDVFLKPFEVNDIELERKYLWEYSWLPTK